MNCRDTQIVFVSDMPRAREAKLAHGLRSLGCRVILLYQETPGFEVATHFDESRHYTEPEEALALAREYDPLAYHLFANWNFNMAAAFIERGPGPVVFDNYDLLNGMVFPEFMEQHYPGQLALERRCLEQADGLACRDLSSQYLRRELGFRLRGRRIYLPDSCWGTPLSGVEAAEPADELHVVYCGNMALEKYTSGLERNTCVHLWLADLLTRQGVHYHLYPSTSVQPHLPFEEAFSDYFELAQQTPLLHLHRPLPAESLIAEMARYDAGILVLSESLEAPLTRVMTAQRYIHASSNKVFDYLDAELPVLLNRCNPFIRFQLGRYGASIDATFERLGRLSECDLGAMSAGVRLAKAAYATPRLAARLVRFYQALPSTIGARA